MGPNLAAYKSGEEQRGGHIVHQVSNHMPIMLEDFFFLVVVSPTPTSLFWCQLKYLQLFEPCCNKSLLFKWRMIEGKIHYSPSLDHAPLRLRISRLQRKTSLVLLSAEVLIIVLALPYTKAWYFSGEVQNGDRRLCDPMEELKFSLKSSKYEKVKSEHMKKSMRTQYVQYIR